MGEFQFINGGISVCVIQLVVIVIIIRTLFILLSSYGKVLERLHLMNVEITLVGPHQPVLVASPLLLSSPQQHFPFYYSVRKLNWSFFVNKLEITLWLLLWNNSFSEFTVHSHCACYPCCTIIMVAQVKLTVDMSINKFLHDWVVVVAHKLSLQ